MYTFTLIQRAIAKMVNDQAETLSQFFLITLLAKGRLLILDLCLLIHNTGCLPWGKNTYLPETHRYYTCFDLLALFIYMGCSYYISLILKNKTNTTLFLKNYPKIYAMYSSFIRYEDYARYRYNSKHITISIVKLICLYTLDQVFITKQ